MNKTNHTVFALVAAGVLLLGASSINDAHAETVRATQSVRVMKTPGERSRVVTRATSGDAMKVIARRGRWIKVRVNGRTGWVTRTSVRGTRQARTPARRVRRRPFVEGRSRRRSGWTRSAPRDRVGADAIEEDTLDDSDFEEPPKQRKRSRPKARRAVLDDEMKGDDEEEEIDAAAKAKVVIVAVKSARLRSRPTSKARKKNRVALGDELTMLRKSKSGSWMLVEDSNGSAGWIRSSEVEGDGFTYPKVLKRAGARLGYASIGTIFASDGVGELANYKITTAAASLQVGGDYVYKYSPQYFLAADATYTGTRASPGIRYQNMAGQAADIAFTSHEVQAGARVGYNFKNKSGMAAYARVGYHYSKLTIHDVDDFEKNLAMLPSEILKGITIGGHVDIPRFKKKIGIRAGADAMYPQGQRIQTKGLEDGAVSSTFAAWAYGHAIYQWKPNITLEAMYRYSYAKTEWTGQATGSMRPHQATEAARKDVGHTVMVGVGKKF